MIQISYLTYFINQFFKKNMKIYNNASMIYSTELIFLSETILNFKIQAFLLLDNDA